MIYSEGRVYIINRADLILFLKAFAEGLLTGLGG